MKVTNKLLCLAALVAMGFPAALTTESLEETKRSEKSKHDLLRLQRAQDKRLKKAMRRH